MGVVNHVVKVRRRTVSVCDARIVANNVDVDTVTLDLDSEWNGLSTVVAFGDGDDQVMVSVGVEPVEIPRSLTTASGYLPVTVIGYGGDGLPRMVTAAAPHAMIIVNSGVVPDQSYPEAPDLIGQLVTAGERANEAADNANAAAGNANAAVDRANELAGKLGDIDAQVTSARGSADAAAESAQQASASASAAQTSEHNAANSATQASQSATAAKQSEDNAAESARNAASSERNAASSAEQAANVVASVSGSVAQAENAARSASQSATAAAGSASAAGGSAQAAADSASKAGESATAAKASERNAASSAAQAAENATAAAQSASEAQDAVDGFGLTVGSVTTGEPGTDASVDITKDGTKYTANFTIPRGDIGPAGVNENVPLGTASGIVAQATDAYPALPRKVQVHGRTVDVHTVEPEKLVVAGKNIYDESYATLNPYWGRGEFDENGDLLIYSNADTINSYAAFNIVKSDYQFPGGEYVVSVLIPNIPNSRLNVYNQTDKNYALQVNNKYPSVTSGNVTINPEKKYTVNIEFATGVGTTEAVKVSDIQIERGAVLTSYSKPETTFTNLPSDISLADGDTLTIDRDGTTQIVHAEGEPTVLENVTLPELPVPTFNVYTTGGSIQPTVDVDYEKDVNLVLQALEAKIAALEVANETNNQ